MITYKNVKKPKLNHYNHVYLITHDDLDGAGCEIVTKQLFKDCYFSIFHYNYNIVDNEVEKLIPIIEKEKKQGENIYVIVADVCLKPRTIELLDNLYHKGLDIVLIDHHKPSFDYIDYEWTIVDNKYAATKMMYDFLVDEKNKSFTSYYALSKFVEIVSDYDTWKWSENNDWNPVHLNDLFYQLEISIFVENIIEKINKNLTNFINSTECCFLKKLVWNNRDIVFKEYNNRLSIYLEEELKIGIVDDFSDFPDNHSLFGHYVLENNDIDFVILVNKSTQRISFRSKNFDVNEFAKQFNGGGHTQAAGCNYRDFLTYLNKLPNKKYIKNAVYDFEYLY